MYFAIVTITPENATQRQGYANARITQRERIARNVSQVSMDTQLKDEKMTANLVHVYLGASVFILLVKCTALIAPKDMKETFVRDAKMDILEIQRAKMDEEQG